MSTSVEAQPPLSLFSLSELAASAEPIPIPNHSSNANTDAQLDASPSSLSAGPIPGSYGTTGTAGASVGSLGGLRESRDRDNKFHKKASSQGRMRRRLSDAKDAASRPSSLQMSALSSLATLTLSSSSPITATFPSSLSHSTTTPAAVNKEVVAGSISVDESAFLAAHRRGSVPNVVGLEPPTGPQVTVAPIVIAKNGKKRGTDFKCESCSKIYRHPSCLIKHRWEHTPHWRESSKYVLSKHQQVQLLEAAAILSHMCPTSTSLPEDRSLWPSFLSGGTLPLLTPVTDSTTSTSPGGATHGKSSGHSTRSFTPARSTSSSVPASSLLSSFSPSSRSGMTTRGSSAAAAAAAGGGPKMHDFSIPGGAMDGLRVVGTGVIGVTTTKSRSDTPRMEDDRAGAVPISVPVAQHVAAPDGSWGSSSALSVGATPSLSTSLPRSSIRSGSDSASRSRSGSRESDGYLNDDGFRTTNKEVHISSGSRRSVHLHSARRGRPTAAYGAFAGDLLEEDMEDDTGFAEDEGGDVDMTYNEKTWKKSAGAMEDVEEEWDGMEMEMEMD